MGRAPRTPRTAAVERELAHEEAVADLFSGQTAVRSDDAESHGQIESGAFFLDVGRSQVDGDVGGRDVVSAVFQRSADPVAALAHRGIGQADRVEMVLIALDAGAVDLHLNNVRVDAVDRGAESFIEHAKSESLAQTHESRALS